MQTGLNFKLGLATAIFIITSSANAHFVHGTADAPAHNLNHALPLLGLGVVAATIGFAAYRSFKSK